MGHQAEAHGDAAPALVHQQPSPLPIRVVKVCQGSLHQGALAHRLHIDQAHSCSWVCGKIRAKDDSHCFFALHAFPPKYLLLSAGHMPRLLLRCKQGGPAHDQLCRCAVLMAQESYIYTPSSSQSDVVFMAFTGLCHVCSQMRRAHSVTAASAKRVRFGCISNSHLILAATALSAVHRGVKAAAPHL